MKPLRYGLSVRVRLPLLLLCALSPVAQARDYTYITRNGSIIITEYTGSGGAVIIPPTIDGLPVTSIGSNAFAHRENLTSVTIPDTVTDIGDDAFDSLGGKSRLARITMGNSVIRIGSFAFSACDKLTSATIPGSVTGIGKGAFLFCTSLTSVAIPRNVTSIGDRAFNACFSLKGITVDANNTAYCSVDGVLYNKSLSSLIQYPAGKAGDYTIPDTVTNIAELALWNCPRLTSVTIPDGITRIGDEAFAACNRLVKVTIPKSVTSIGSDAFDSCESLTAIFFQGNAPRLDRPRRTMFNGAKNPTIYYLPGTTGWGSKFAGRPTAPWKP